MMLTRASVLQRLASVRQPARAARLAAALWILWAVVVWNVVFDHVTIVAGRHYVYAAFASAETGGPYLLIGDWMRPAVTRAFWMATMSAGAIAMVGLAAVWVATLTVRTL
jgi:hypothetical protein